ncbi:hypothetical protein NUW54_g8403 [Trametes sanguinea]|uniref:Uncharacterized protein n=1 Tax=Trametes sanguinea TaxID=158606 RepID=A0ACC1PG31_9APHY|nr:hypothetical protein NUW54_g8403 [Trametes sanguinea]
MTSSARAQVDDAKCVQGSQHGEDHHETLDERASHTTRLLGILLLHIARQGQLLVLLAIHARSERGNGRGHGSGLENGANEKTDEVTQTAVLRALTPGRLYTPPGPDAMESMRRPRGLLLLIRESVYAEVSKGR